MDIVACQLQMHLSCDVLASLCSPCQPLVTQLPAADGLSVLPSKLVCRAHHVWWRVHTATIRRAAACVSELCSISVSPHGRAVGTSKSLHGLTAAAACTLSSSPSQLHARMLHCSAPLLSLQQLGLGAACCLPRWCLCTRISRSCGTHIELNVDGAAGSYASSTPAATTSSTPPAGEHPPLECESVAQALHGTEGARVC